MKEKISMVKLTEKQAQAVKGGLMLLCTHDPLAPRCKCFYGEGYCVYQIAPDRNLCYVD